MRNVLPENKFIVLAGPTVEKRDADRPFEMLRRWLVECPQCLEVRLVVGARENDRYVCKDCGHSFTITHDRLAKPSREDQ